MYVITFKIAGKATSINIEDEDELAMFCLGEFGDGGETEEGTMESMSIMRHLLDGIMIHIGYTTWELVKTS